MVRLSLSAPKRSGSVVSAEDRASILTPSASCSRRTSGFHNISSRSPRSVTSIPAEQVRPCCDDYFTAGVERSLYAEVLFQPSLQPAATWNMLVASANFVRRCRIVKRHVDAPIGFGAHDEGTDGAGPSSSLKIQVVGISSLWAPNVSLRGSVVPVHALQSLDSTSVTSTSVRLCLPRWSRHVCTTQECVPSGDTRARRR